MRQQEELFRIAASVEPSLLSGENGENHPFNQFIPKLAGLRLIIFLQSLKNHLPKLFCFQLSIKFAI